MLERIEAMREGGLSYAAIAAAVGSTPKSVEWQCLRWGIPTPLALRRKAGRYGRPFTAAEDARLLDLEGEGLSLGRIAVTLGRGKSSVQARLLTLARREAEGEAA